MAVAHSIFTLDGGMYGCSAFDLSFTVVPLKITIGLKRNIGIFMAITSVTLAFFQPSGTHKNTNKSNVCLSMLFFSCYFCSVRPFWYMLYGI